jgi:hypothetical protein
MKESMLKLGFKQVKSKSEDISSFTMESNGVFYEVSIKIPGNFTGSKFPACGTEICWKATIREKSPFLTLKQLLAELPILIDPRIDKQIYEAFSDQKTENLSIGGTWKMYYTWEAEFIPEPGQNLLQEVKDLAKSRDFGTYTKQDDYDVFCREKTMSYMYIYKSKTNNNITVRIQPQS